MTLDKYSRLKIAGNILDETITSMAKDWEVTLQTVKGVCDGSITSERISNKIDAKIKKAEKKFDDYRSKENLANCNK